MIGSLFSGIGGLERGLERAGLGTVAWQAEIDPYARAVLARHWPEAKRYSDVREVTREATSVDVVCGGFPCQPVSVAGTRHGASDARWLWPEFARVIRDVGPGIVVAENVPGLRTLGLRGVLGDLTALGFDAEWTTFGASSIGGPHRRLRIFIVATHPDRINIRLEPGWLSRACWASAILAAGDGEARASADANAQGQQQPEGRFADFRGWARDSGWREAPSPLRGVDDGLPGRLDAGGDDAGRRESQEGDGIEATDSWRIAALGNAVVEPCAYVVGRAIVNAIGGVG